MEHNEAVEQLKKMVIDHGLPETDMALFGVYCPYCGKSDRIRQLESPDELEGDIGPEASEMYDRLWSRLAPPDQALAVCKFCQNPLGLHLEKGTAEALFRG